MAKGSYEMNFKQFLQENIVYLDGGTGTLLQAAGLPLGELPERWNLTRPEIIKEIHKAYFDAGSNVVATNTFGANTLKFSDGELTEIVREAIAAARAAQRETTGAQPKFVALDIGPLGKLLKPYGDLDFEDAVAAFAKTVKLGVKYGVDLVLIETLGDSLETKAALLAVKENCDLPVLVSCAYGNDGKLMTGATPSAMVAMIEGMGADAVGVNCSFGPKQTAKIVEELLKTASIPVLVKPNAGLPTAENGKTVYDVSETEFAAQMRAFIEQGARLVGGCCGTTPAYIRALKSATADCKPLPLTEKNRTCVSSYTHAVVFDAPVLIGERINPTGKKRLREALLRGDIEYVLNEGIAQADKGVEILDVNVGAPGVDETTELPRYIKELQAVVDLPLQLDTANPVALERAMRGYNGKPLVNSVNGKKESMDAVFPLVQKYGGLVVALTLDENGIPETAEGRLAIAKRIINEGKKYGLKEKDFIVDTLAMAISADGGAAATTLDALRKVKTELGAHTSLGVSNVSFGLPQRETVNAAFFAMALENGLSAAIVNPNAEDMLKTRRAFCALRGYDKNCAKYIECFSGQAQPAPTETETASLRACIVRGLKKGAAEACAKALATRLPLELVDSEIVPALDEVGRAYEEKRAYLPQLLTAAEAAQAAFEEIRRAIESKGGAQTKKCTVVLATVQGDIHDIGKNIVRTLLNNYGFDVVDLGRDVPPARIAETVEKLRAPLVGLSALMTTTLPSMEETVRLLRARTPDCKIMVGGAVLTQDYANQIGADFYGKDGMSSVRYAETVFASLCKNIKNMQ